MARKAKSQPVSPLQALSTSVDVVEGFISTARDSFRVQRHLTRMESGPRRGLSREEAALYIGISLSKFDQLRKEGRIGPPRLIDGRKVWDVHQLDRDFDSFPMEVIATDEDWSTSV